MKHNLVNKLTDYTRNLKINEEVYIKKYKELVGDESTYSNKFELDLNQKNENFLKVINNSNEVIQKRDNEISNLVNSINELASIFKDFQALVMEQGTILDRIDYNIETAFQNTKNANKQLEKAHKNLEKNCSRNTNIILLIAIFVMSLLLIFKYLK